MPKRSSVSLNDITAWDNLVVAAFLAAKGKRRRLSVQAFMANFDKNLCQLRCELLDGTIEVGRATAFEIYDPKQRTIRAPFFAERVLHHALMRQLGPVLDRSLVADTFACRVGKGSLAAVFRTQEHSRRFAWYGKLDVRQYFASIRQDTLIMMLARRFKNSKLMSLLQRIVEASGSSGRGLPIGALTSQHFANFYLGQFDRFMLEDLKVRGFVRYMDDVAWWCETKAEALMVAERAADYMANILDLTAKRPMPINRSHHGIGFCGYRVFPATIRLLRRRRKLYTAGRRKWEIRFAENRICKQELQAAYSSVLGMTIHADAQMWRGGELKRYPVLEACRHI